MTTRQPRRRPWWVHDRLTDDWLAVEREGGDLKMLKGLKILRAIIVNLGIITITLYAVYSGGEPTVVGGLGLAVLGGYNGAEVMDYLSLLQAIAEAQDQQQTDGGDGP